MSLHIGLVRIGDASSAPMMDILFDTTDSDISFPVFANVAYSALGRAAENILRTSHVDLGVQVDAY
jgi:hypothetical protein